MGLDLYIEARIREKQTGRAISADPYEECVDEEDKGFLKSAGGAAGRFLI